MASENQGQAVQTGGRFLPPRSTLDEPLSRERGSIQVAPLPRSATKTESGISVTQPATASAGPARNVSSAQIPARPRRQRKEWIARDDWPTATDTRGSLHL